MKIRNLAGIFVLASVVTGCGMAQELPPYNPPPLLPPSPLNLNCPAAKLLIDAPGQLKLDWGPCIYTFTSRPTTPAVAEAESDIVLTQPIAAKTVESWIGTAQSGAVEYGIDVTATTPDGHMRYFADEFDKHYDVTGEQWHRWSGSWNFPAGTVLHLHASIGVLNPSANCPTGCAHEFVLLMQGDLP